ncbi:MAG TPA: hypothetical protein ACFYEH_01655 [Candidatus Brocadiaceae bacterium]
METLVFCVSCAVAFVIGYIISKCVLDSRSAKSCGKLISEKYINKAIPFLNIFLALQIGLGLYALSREGLNYSAIFNLKMSMNFLFESRMLALVLLGFVYLNKPPETWLKEKRLRFTAKLLFLYFIISLFMQSRSVVFEFGTVIAFSWLMWQGNKIKIKYIVILLCIMVIPNLIVLPRFGGALDWQTIIAGIFSFEYTVAMNNIVSAAIADSHPLLLVDLFWGIPSLLIPSPIRKAIGIDLTPGPGGDYYLKILEDAGVFGGGFSLLAETYMNLGWWAILLFVFLGFLIGKFIKGAARVGGVDLLYATAPLMYASFIIAFRNNFATFAKYSIQLILIAMIIKIILKIRWIPLTSATNNGQRVERVDATTGDIVTAID